MNKLAKEQSLYLRHAAAQKIDWHPWSEEAFELARRENKPVFLSTGAVWCHWCHVMAKESFEDEETARLLNEHFINIKLDRDERPDIDRRFQQAVAAMGSGSGWPLSVFLTPDKKPFFGGTYFPPEDSQGGPGFRNVLKSVSNFYKTRKSDAVSYAASVMTVLEPEVSSPEQLSVEMLDQAEKDILSMFDYQNGGFGTAPKFPMPGALEFLLRRFSAGRQEAGDAARLMLDAMARGGFHDQLGGGFHRYSVDAAWLVPHFEKMTDDNAGLLANYIEAFSLLGEERFKQAAESIIRYIGTELSDPEGGFYASQDADVTPDDEGGYFTWTDAELKEILEDGEFRVFSEHLVHPRGRMHHNPDKAVLALNRDPAEIAEKLGMNTGAVEDLIRRASAKALSKRGMRTAPLIDKMLYTSLNGMMTAAYFRASMVLDRYDLREFALKTLSRIMTERVDGSAVFHAQGVPGMLDDYIHLVNAHVAAYEATGKAAYLRGAEELMNSCRKKFLDHDAGGFFDTATEVLGTRLKRIEDVPHPSANAVAVMVLLKLAFITGKEIYRQDAERSLSVFASPARSMDVHAGSYFCALDAYYQRSTVTLETDPDSELARYARAVAGRYFSTISYAEDHGRVVRCLNGVCLEPITDERFFKDIAK